MLLNNLITSNTIERMDKAAKLKLKQFLEDNIPFSALKKAGFFDKSIRKTDYEKIAARVCWYFSFKSIYEYKVICQGSRCNNTNCDGLNEHCKRYNPNNVILQWPKLKVDIAELVSKDHHLN